MIRVAFVGHSYVKDLASISDRFDKFHNCVDFETKYFFRPESCFVDLVNWPQQFHDLFEYKPDFVIVYLGGNSIVDSKSDKELKHFAKVFFTQIRSNLPRVTIIASQIELRFVEPNHRFGTPTLDTFSKRRNRFNIIFRKPKI